MDTVLDDVNDEPSAFFLESEDDGEDDNGDEFDIEFSVRGTEASSEVPATAEAAPEGNDGITLVDKSPVDATAGGTTFLSLGGDGLTEGGFALEEDGDLAPAGGRRQFPLWTMKHNRRRFRPSRGRRADGGRLCPGRGRGYSPGSCRGETPISPLDDEAQPEAVPAEQGTKG